MTESEVIDLLARQGALRDGHFLLTSGLHSSRYIEKFRLLELPSIAVPMCAEIAKHFASKKPMTVLGAVTGGVILSFEVARQLGIRSIFAERENNTLTLRRGFMLGIRERVLVVDDILTTGGSIKELRKLVRDANAEVVGTAVLVDRRKSSEQKDDVFALLHLDIPAYAPDDCPLCASGAPLVKPGSRKIA